MLFQYALEPEVLPSYERCRYFFEKFGIHRGRLLGSFPPTWLRLVEAGLQKERDEGRCTEMEFTRATVMLTNVKTCMVPRAGDYNEKSSWLNNAENEHFRQPFHAIIATQNPRRREFVLRGGELDETHPLWKVPASVSVDREAAAMAALVFPLLQISETLVFVDPHFGPETLRYRLAFKELITACTRGRANDPHSVVYLTGTYAQNDFFLQECQAQLPRLVPQGLTVRMTKLSERVGGQKLHNRFVMSERGGISLGIGLDKGSAGESDDAFLLDLDLHAKRWAEYMGTMPAFDECCSTEVVGTAKR